MSALQRKGLDAEQVGQKERILASGPMPIISGPWQRLPDHCLGEMQTFLQREADVASAPTPQFKVLSARIARPSFYRSAEFIECLVRLGRSRREGVIGLVMCDGVPLVLNGTSSVPHVLNAKAGLSLETTEQACDYLKFFCSAIQGEDGVFKILESGGELPWRAGADARMKAGLSGCATPLLVERPGAYDASGKSSSAIWSCRAQVLYAATLFVSDFMIEANGSVSMLNDDCQSRTLPLMKERYLGIVRALT